MKAHIKTANDIEQIQIIESSNFYLVTDISKQC